MQIVRVRLPESPDTELIRIGKTASGKEICALTAKGREALQMCEGKIAEGTIADESVQSLLEASRRGEVYLSGDKIIVRKSSQNHVWKYY
jgi:hypothetical protein